MGKLKEEKKEKDNRIAIMLVCGVILIIIGMLAKLLLFIGLILIGAGVGFWYVNRRSDIKTTGKSE